MSRPAVARACKAAAVVALLTIPSVAFAQIGGGGGGTGVLAPIVNWITGNLVGDLITLAIIVVGVSLLAMRFSPLFVVSVCVGSWIVLNSGTLRGLF